MVEFHIPPRPEREIERARQIISDTAREYGFDLELLRCGSKRPDLSYARQRAAGFAYRDTAVTVAEIGRILNRDPSTIRQSLRLMGVMI
jgi:chromosomal replication initiation ATPase DnaA